MYKMLANQMLAHIWGQKDRYECWASFYRQSAEEFLNRAIMAEMAEVREQNAEHVEENKVRKKDFFDYAVAYEYAARILYAELAE